MDIAPSSDAPPGTGHRPHVTPMAHAVQPSQRAARFGHGGCVLWLTGLSGAGKSTLAMALEAALNHLGYACYALDGDNLRKGLNADLDFTPEARSENIRRTGEVAALFGHSGMVCIAALISPYAEDRARARCAAMAMGVPFHEVFVAADLATCEARDPKGLYRKARQGQLRGFTGVDAPYEAPELPEVLVRTGAQTPLECLEQLVAFVCQTHPLEELESHPEPVRSGMRPPPWTNTQGIN